MSRKNVLFLLISAVVAALLLSACGSSMSSDNNGGSTNQNSPEQSGTESAIEFPGGTYQTLTIDEFAAIVENRADDYQIINVHIPYAGEVANTDTNIPYNDLEALTAAIPSKDTPVILYCRSGNMSEQASRALIEQGYTQVWDVPGGLVAWQDSGRELIDK
ncbi:MAG TPA: rhodanese-like domain-containing protein [Aggregatilinea sp.]|uniref:rhodanese-like domain-containing protein n=1 Tax=Aggregatilinea sp. TaxID=2806333 RepID=UPI002BD07635|nr:rhodanese-like domain-containing protein [Aggregatilinea sp.]HML22449.1 rhodanese-like domain-containing protein [Aggregatilinea sp.]